LKTPIGKYSKNIFDLIFYGKGASHKYTVEYISQAREKRHF
jgi:hypothetical protein